MDFRFTKSQERFRQELKEFLEKELPRDVERSGSPTAVTGSEDVTPLKAFSKKLAQRGWIGLAWPKEYGGQALSYLERAIYNEMMVYYGAPTGYHFMAERQMGPSLILNGTDEQKKFFLPRIVRGECSICIGYTEPNAGSDLASLQTRAVQDGDDFVINGQKIFTSGAHYADYVWLATRTNPDAPKHKGVSVFLVDMRSPGITILPFYSMAGNRLNQVLFENVRVPRSAMVGEQDRGWYVVAANLDFERSGIERIIDTLRIYEGLVDYVKTSSGTDSSIRTNPLVRHRLADLAIGFELGRWLSYRVAWLQSSGKIPNYEASAAKVFGSELGQRVANVGLNILGLYGQLARNSKWARLHGQFMQNYLSTVSSTIVAGTSEIQRNIIATRGLGLPR